MTGGQELELRRARMEDEAQFRAASRAFAQATPPFDFAFHFEESCDFLAYLNRLELWSQGRALPERFVPNTFLVGSVGDRIVARVSIRHELNESLADVGGHIGYGVLPAYRNRGYGRALLALALPYAAELGIDPVLVTCDADNIRSIRVIEANGGRFDGLAQQPGLAVSKRRYWIEQTCKRQPRR